MIALLQRVRSAAVSVDGAKTATISAGVLVFLGIEQEDNARMLSSLCGQVAALRMFNDSAGKMNLSVVDVDGDVLVVSQFTLCADTGSGRRPSYARAAPSAKARTLYDGFVHTLSQQIKKPVAGGVFGANMVVHIENDGPATFILRK